MGQSELVGVPQPYSIFVDQFIPLPGGGKLMFFIDILMWLKDQYPPYTPAVVCPHLKNVSDPAVQNALREVRNSKQTSPSSCPSFEQRMECNGTLIARRSFTSMSRDECKTYCEVQGSHCCEWYQRADGYKFCTGFVDCFAQTATHNSNIGGSFCSTCGYSTPELAYVFAIQSMYGIRENKVPQINYIGVDDCAAPGVFCNVRVLRVYPRITTVWYLRISQGISSSTNNATLTIEPMFYPTSMWGPVGVTVSRSSPDTILLPGSSILCGNFDVSSWYYSHGSTPECGNRMAHALRQSKFLLRICNDKSMSMVEVGEENVQWETGGASATTRAGLSAWLFISVVLIYLALL